MGLLRGTVLGAISALYLATAAPAQEGGEGLLQVPSEVHAGTQIEIVYSNPNRGGQAVVIQATDGLEEGDTILIILNEDGEGTGEWEVSEDWHVVHFNAPGALVSRWISEQN